jgi:hypothetical protein
MRSISEGQVHVSLNGFFLIECSISVFWLQAVTTETNHAVLLKKELVTLVALNLRLEN